MYPISAITGTVTAITAFLFKFNRTTKQNCYGQPGQTNPGTPQISYEGQCVPLQTSFVVPKTTKGITGQTVAPQLYNFGSITVSQTNYIGPFSCTCTDGQPSANLSTISTAQCYVMDCVSNYNGQLYIEASGGQGGDFTFYDSNAKKVTYNGGQNGTIFGTVNIKPNDHIIVHFGYDAEMVTTTELSKGIYSSTPGNGGSGAILGGSNGGGSTNVYLNKQLLMVAGGGGGASRNASGGQSGNAGKLTYKQVHPNTNPNGQPGGSLFQLVNTATVSNVPNGISGGGATLSKGGRGLDTTGLPFTGANASEANYGGGGGGAGFYGGAAGSWNNLLKPNNLHGAGGGGSSFIDNSVYFSSNQQGICPWPRTSTSGTSSYVVFGYPQL